MARIKETPRFIELLRESLREAPALKQARSIIKALDEIDPGHRPQTSRVIAWRHTNPWVIQALEEMGTASMLNEGEHPLSLYLSPAAMLAGIGKGVVDTDKQLSDGKGHTYGLGDFKLLGPYTWLCGALVSHKYEGVSWLAKIVALRDDWSLEAKTQAAAFMMLQRTDANSAVGLKLLLSGVDPFAVILDPETKHAKSGAVLEAPLRRGMLAELDAAQTKALVAHALSWADTPEKRGDLLTWVAHGSRVPAAKPNSFAALEMIAKAARHDGTHPCSTIAVMEAAIADAQGEKNSGQWRAILNTMTGPGPAQAIAPRADAAEFIRWIGAYHSPCGLDLFKRSGGVETISNDYYSRRTMNRNGHSIDILSGPWSKDALGPEGFELAEKFVEVCERANSKTSAATVTTLLDELYMNMRIAEPTHKSARNRM